MGKGLSFNLFFLIDKIYPTYPLCSFPFYEHKNRNINLLLVCNTSMGFKNSYLFYFFSFFKPYNFQAVQAKNAV